MAISSFHTHIIGADRPVGRHLARLMAEQNLIYRGVAIESVERPMLQSSARPVYLIAPSLQDERDLENALYWIDVAKDQDAIVILMSSLHGLSPDGMADEDGEITNEDSQSQALGVLEARARLNPQHVILRVGQLLTLEGDDFAGRILNHIRSTPTLALDMQRQFEPTPADDVAVVLMAVLRQVNLSDQLWGTYHFAGVEAVTSFGFAEALLSEARQYEDLSNAELTTEAGGLMPDVWTPLSSHERLFHTFGIKAKPWRQGLARLIRRYYRADESLAAE